MRSDRPYSLVDYPVQPIITFGVSGHLQRRKRLLPANVLFKLKFGVLVSTGGHLRLGCLKLLNSAHYALASSLCRKTRGKIRSGWPFWRWATPVRENGRSPLLDPLTVAQYDSTLGAGPRMRSESRVYASLHRRRGVCRLTLCSSPVAQRLIRT